MPKPQPHPHCTLDQEEGQGHPRILELSAPQMQIEPLDKQLQIGGDTVRAQTEEIQAKSLGGTPSILLPESILPVYPFVHRICPGANKV